MSHAKRESANLTIEANVLETTAPSSHGSDDPERGYEVAVVVPTYKERDNVAELVHRLEACFKGVRWELVVVDDDSPDATADAVRSLSRIHPHVRCVQRIGRRGLSSASIEGILATAAPFVAVMDGDLQHDERILPKMLQQLKSDNFDIAIGSRYVSGGGIGSWDDQRAMFSRLATRISHLVVPPTLNDPMSGFFMIRRDAFMHRVRNLSAIGFKILVDLFASGSPKLRFVEIPYQFRERIAGESKLDRQVVWDYGILLLDKLVGRFVPVRFISFAIIGGIGVGVHLTVLSLLFKSGFTTFLVAQASATFVAMVFNFSVNNAITYRDQRLTGVRWFAGLVTFTLACLIGALANVGIAQYLFEQRGGWLVAALAGIIVGAGWNYAVTAVYTWGKPRA
jgi:dolichol-phosphate mannosyltransferase